MKEIVIPMHSFVDVITNSSTEVFIAAGKNSIEAIKDILQKIISVSGSTKTVNDLFDISLKEEACYNCQEKDWKLDYCDCPFEEKESMREDLGPRRDLIVKYKGEDDTDIIRDIFNLFQIEGFYNG